MILEGVLVDLVPCDHRFRALEHRWENNESAFWGDAGNRQFLSRQVIERRQQERPEHTAPRTVIFGIQTKGGLPIGVFGIGDFGLQHRLAMLGAAIGEPQYWGGGYGTDALLLAIDYAFGWLDLRRVWLQTMSSNARVVRQMEKVGFTLEGRQRQATCADGVWQDMLCFGLLRQDWPGREALIERLGLHKKAMQRG